MKYLLWLLKAAIFFTLFAFALNNQNEVAVNFFFGTVWRAPLVLVVLVTFACGLALGVLVMVPRWWKKKPLASPEGINAHHQPVASHPLDAHQSDSMKIPRHGL